VPADARRYWIEQMEAAHGFMQKVLACPVAESGEPLECLKAASHSAGLEMIFPRKKHLGVFDRLFHVRRSLMEPLLRTAELFLRRGYVLRIEDAYRSPEAQARGACCEYVVQTVFQKVRWELKGEMPTPEQVFKRLAVWSATTPIFANHTAGSAVDVSMLRRRDRSALDMGAPYPELSHRTPMDSPFVSRRVRRRRQMVCELFAQEGFAPYPFEFWHFSHGDADYQVAQGTGKPATYGPVQWAPGSRRPIPIRDIRKPFVTVDDIRACLRGLGCR